MNTSYPQPRLHGLDALRAFALLLGIVLHASMSFMPNAQFFWLVHDVNRSDLASVFFYTLHVFRMPLFFLLVGFFSQTMLEQRGVQSCIKNRLKRIVLPLIIFWPMIFGLLVAAIIYAAWVRHNGSFPKTTTDICFSGLVYLKTYTAMAILTAGIHLVGMDDDTTDLELSVTSSFACAGLWFAYDGAADRIELSQSVSAATFKMGTINRPVNLAHPILDRLLKGHVWRRSLLGI